MKYRKKPVVVEAFRFGFDEMPKWFVSKWFFEDNEINYILPHGCSIEEAYCEINTLEGVMIAKWGDYIIKGVHGELYPCKADIFEETYELAE